MRLYVSPFSFILSNFHYRGNFSSFHGIYSFDVSSTKENTNYARVCRLLVDVGSHVLRVSFDKIRPAGGLDTVLGSPSITATLQSLRRKKILNPLQWGKLYPAIRSSVSSEKFDITLLMVLLRSICGLPPPVTGWDKLRYPQICLVRLISLASNCTQIQCMPTQLRRRLTMLHLKITGRISAIR